MSDKLQLVEVSPRDGLQNEPTLLSLAQKLQLIESLCAAGIQRIEVASFVHPKLVPAMADAEAICTALQQQPHLLHGATPIGLVLNRKGFERALKAGIQEIGFVAAISRVFNEKNQGSTLDETLDFIVDAATEANKAGIAFNITLSTVFGCPFTGKIPPVAVQAMVKRLAKLGNIEIGLADTIGVATPLEVSHLFSDMQRIFPDITWRGHFHNTRNTGLANVFAAWQTGVRIFDTSLGGIGGCPFAPGATGNVPTEDVVYMLSNMAGDFSLPLLLHASHQLGTMLEKNLPAALPKAGIFPPIKN
ncbi:MAG: hydroxymethylglutaryl-CoA lyase [Alphaproteobacteria bacterium]